jgi:hypothetical protein
VLNRMVDIFCAISRSRVTGPRCLEDAINCVRYCGQILYSFASHLSADDTARFCSQQDSVPAHMVLVIVALLCGVFGERMI